MDQAKSCIAKRQMPCITTQKTRFQAQLCSDTLRCEHRFQHRIDSDRQIYQTGSTDRPAAPIAPDIQKFLAGVIRGHQRYVGNGILSQLSLCAAKQAPAASVCDVLLDPGIDGPVLAAGVDLALVVFRLRQEQGTSEGFRHSRCLIGEEHYWRAMNDWVAMPF